MNLKIMIIGATSDIAQNIAKIYAHANCDLFLVGRNESHLNMIAKDINLRGSGKVICETLDINEIEKHPLLLTNMLNQFKEIDILLIAHGTLPNQKSCETLFAETYATLRTNLLSTLSILTCFSNYFENRKQGTIAVITSVAGDKGRQSNYVYGTAKGALTIFLQGLRCRLSKSNVNVMTIKPGFVDTPMTARFKKNILWCSSSYVAREIVKGIGKRKSVIYVPFYWRYIIWFLKMLPEKIFSRLSL